VQEATIWRRLLGLGEDTVVEAVDYDAERDAVVASVRPRARRPSKKRPYVLACRRCGPFDEIRRRGGPPGVAGPGPGRVQARTSRPTRRG
jgi:hypothetical protein